MQKDKIKNSFEMFSNLYALVFSAILVAISVTGKMFAFNIGETIRISYENLPVVFAGMVFGPFVGFAVGICADLCGCLAVGFSINPIIMLGMGSLGLVSGFMYIVFGKRFSIISVVIVDAVAHITSSIIIKTVGIAVYYGTENGFFALLLSRVVSYLPVMVFEMIVLVCLFSNAHIRKELMRFNR